MHMYEVGHFPLGINRVSFLSSPSSSSLLWASALGRVGQGYGEEMDRANNTHEGEGGGGGSAVPLSSRYAAL